MYVECCDLGELKDSCPGWFVSTEILNEYEKNERIEKKINKASEMVATETHYGLLARHIKGIHRPI